MKYLKNKYKIITLDIGHCLNYIYLHEVSNARSASVIMLKKKTWKDLTQVGPVYKHIRNERYRP
jgi:hypothetical protein